MKRVIKGLCNEIMLLCLKIMFTYYQVNSVYLPSDKHYAITIK